jgi:hypothetical protein
MQSDLKIKRGLFKNTIHVDGEDYKVNEGYLKPASIGFIAAGGANILGNILSKNKIGFSKALGSGVFGAIAGTGITEAKKRQIENIFNKDPESAKSLAKKGFSIKNRIMNSSIPKLEWMSDLIREQNSELGQELLKVSSMNELKMLRQLDTTEDDASLAHFGLEASGALAVLADTSRPNVSGLTAKTEAVIVIPDTKDNYTSGTRHYSFKEFKKKFPNTWKVSDQEKIKSKGALVISPSDVNSHSFSREASRSLNRSKIMSTLSSVPDNKVVKILNKANTAYSFMASGDDHVADAAAGVQFAMHAPRSIEDIVSTVRAGKLDKKSIIKNTIFSSVRSLPALLPILGRVIRKNQDI